MEGVGDVPCNPTVTARLHQINKMLGDTQINLNRTLDRLDGPTDENGCVPQTSDLFSLLCEIQTRAIDALRSSAKLLEKIGE